MDSPARARRTVRATGHCSYALICSRVVAVTVLCGSVCR